MLYSGNMKAYHCSCGEIDPKNFRGNMKGTCYKCHKEKYKEYYHRDRSEEEHLCLGCETTDYTRFYPNRKSVCKDCIGAAVNKRVIIQNLPFYRDVIQKQGGEFCGRCLRTPKDLGMRSLDIAYDRKTGAVNGFLCLLCRLST